MTRANVVPITRNVTKSMKTVLRDPSELKPYERNQKKHTAKQINNVAESIKQYGFIQPIVIDSDDVVVIGHCRLEASKKLGLENVPVVVVDDLTQEQIDELRIIDNKTNESKWNDFLKQDFSKFQFKGFDLDFKLPRIDTLKTNERDRTYATYNLDIYDEQRTAGRYQMPIIQSTQFVPDDLIGFNYAKSENGNCGIHCFVDDYQFERLWARPKEYVETLRKFQCFLSPDFSLYSDMPLAMKIWNVYRSRMLGQYFQDCGIEVIPTLSCAEPGTFDFCFDGIEKCGTVAVSTIGVKKNKKALEMWAQGMTEAIKRLSPSKVLVYGGDIGYDFGDIQVFYYKNKVTEKMKGMKN